MLPTASKNPPRGVLDCLKKRRLLNARELRPEVCRQHGEKFLELGWWEDALAFFQKGQDAAGLAKIKAHCLASGDAYLLGRTGEKDPEAWRQLGEQALAQGKLRFARKAFELAGETAKVALVESLITGKAAAPLNT